MKGKASHRLARLLDLGTSDYAAAEQRRLKILNVIAVLIVASSSVYALSYALTDAATYRWIIAINTVLIATALCVPLMHRLHRFAGGILIVASECPALFALVALLGRNSGIQLNLIVGAVAGFFIFGHDRRLLSILTAGSCLALHVAAWFLFPVGLLPTPTGLLTQLYIGSAITTFLFSGAIASYAFTLASRAEQATEALLHNILPDEIVERLRAHPEESIADAFDRASILFSDIKSFVPLSHSLGAARTVELLNDMIQRFDALAAKHGVEKIKTIGDACMAVAGLPQPADDHACRLARMAMEMLIEKDAVARNFGVTIHMRIGIASGPVMAGIIGTRKFSYDVWGDAVNLAARLESSGEAERIQVSAEIRRALAGVFECESRGEIEIKGVGAVETWFLTRPCGEPAPAEDAVPARV
jgi:adenylate cyclase